MAKHKVYNPDVIRTEHEAVVDGRLRKWCREWGMAAYLAALVVAFIAFVIWLCDFTTKTMNEDRRHREVIDQRYLKQADDDYQSGAIGIGELHRIQREMRDRNNR